MKYIRTKDGRIFNLFDLIKWNKAQGLDENEISFWESAYRYPEKHKRGLERRILKQADTIEELCDEFVLIVDNRAPYNFPVWDEKQVKHYLHDCYDKDHDVIYGAIWTDKGLIYVAKMNKKGELEVL